MKFFPCGFLIVGVVMALILPSSLADSVLCSNNVDLVTQQSYDNLKSRFSDLFNEYYQLDKTAVSCQLNFRGFFKNFVGNIENRIKYALQDKNDILSSFITEFQCQLPIEPSHPNVDELKRNITSLYNGNPMKSVNVFSLLNSLSDLSDTIRGYRIFFDELKKNNQLYSTATTTIAYRLMNDFLTTKNHNEDAIYLRNEIPESLKNFPWNSWMGITGSKLDMQLYVPLQDTHKFDIHRRNVLTCCTACNATAKISYCKWKLVPADNGQHFYIQVGEINQYLVGESDQFALNNESRRIFTKKEREEQGRWQIEAIPGTIDQFKIKNIYWNEYLYRAETPYQTFYAFHTFLHRSGFCEFKDCNWRISEL